MQPLSMTRKTFYTSLYFFIFIGVMFVSSSKLMANQIKVQVSNIDITKSGNILVMLYSEKGFPKVHQQALAVQVLPTNKQQLIVNFTSVPETFAIKVLHDEDKSGEVSKNWTGFIPSEGLGFSNDAKLFLGPPSFNDAKLSLITISQPIKISVIYP